jgi:hypothetical protein
MKQKVDGHPNLYKDSETNIILNCDSSARSKYLIMKEQARKNIQNTSEIESLRDEIDEIKSLLHQLLNK